MKKLVIPRKEFEKEFGKYTERPGCAKLRRMFERELRVEPVQDIIGIQGAKLRDFHEILELLKYKTRGFLSWNKGEDVASIKTYGDMILGWLKGNRRHLRSWDLTEHSGFIFTTAHNENAPAYALVRPVGTLYSHLLKGHGDYESGTRDFYMELAALF